MYLMYEFCYWFYKDQALPRCFLPPLRIQKSVYALQPCVSRALQGAAYMLPLSFGSLHPSTPPSLLKGAPPVALCLLTLASLCIRCATFVSLQQHLLICQALEDTERLISFCPSSVSPAVLLILIVFVCIYQESRKISWQSILRSEIEMYVFVNGVGEPKHPDPNVQSHVDVNTGMPNFMVCQKKKKNKYPIN